MKIFPNFRQAIRWTGRTLIDLGQEVRDSMTWQGIDVSAKPEMRMHERLNLSFQVALGGNESLESWRRDIMPNLPWADRHFEFERVSGEPINPGETWKEWPYGHSAGKFLDGRGQFNHSYAERYWPKYAGVSEGGLLSHPPIDIDSQPRNGIRYRYGDLNDLVEQLAHDPWTRQAYLPVWFPEDGSHRDRKPCSLGYHFIQRNGFFHCVYYIRSCDFVRHFRDDLYLTLRLQIWILEQLRKGKPKDALWNTIQLGWFTFHCVSMHCFTNDLQKIKSNLHSIVYTA